jgi:hypothetical protein
VKTALKFILLYSKEGGKMSILNKPYKISIWNDIWDDKTLKFKEEFLCVIGANNMTS